MPSKLGQNFLESSKHLQAIIDSADFCLQDEVIEIGGGTGNLTKLIAPCVKKLTAIEVDDKLLPDLRRYLRSSKNTKIVNDDIFQFLKNTELPPKYKVIGNIPYYITGKIIRTVLNLNPLPENLVLLVQKEVAERIVAKSNRHSLLSLSVWIKGKPEITNLVPRGAFRPIPKVDSAVLKITPHNKPLLNPEQEQEFFRIIKIAFSSKRKTLANNLKNVFAVKQVEDILNQNKISPQARAEDLTLEQWVKIVL